MPPQRGTAQAPLRCALAALNRAGSLFSSRTNCFATAMQLSTASASSGAKTLKQRCSGAGQQHCTFTSSSPSPRVLSGLHPSGSVVCISKPCVDPVESIGTGERAVHDVYVGMGD